MHTMVVVVAVVLVVIVVTAAGLLLRSLIASPKLEYRRSLRSIPRIRQGPRGTDINATIRVNRDDWLGTSDHLG
jgi:hypothetical protein